MACLFQVEGVDLERTGKMIRKSYRVIVGLNLGTEHAKVLATKTFDDAHGDALKWATWNFDTRPEPRLQVNISEEQTNQQKEG